MKGKLFLTSGQKKRKVKQNSREDDLAATPSVLRARHAFLPTNVNA